MSVFSEVLQSWVEIGAQPAPYAAEQEVEGAPEPEDMQGPLALGPSSLTALADEPTPGAAHLGLDADLDSVHDHQSITTSTIHRVMEHASVQAHSAAPRSLSQDELRERDNQAAVGNIRLCDHRFPMHVNIMLYGESGLGKTTCIKNLIGMNGKWKIKREGAAFRATAGCRGAGGKTSLQKFKEDPDSLRIELEPVWDGQSNMELHFSFQDMPGWGDDINLVNSMKTVLEFLLRQRMMDYTSMRAGETEHDPVPGAKMRRAMTVCLYFVPPHQAKPIDYVMMAAISKLVAVIPVIAKADTFTQQEMEDFRQELLQVLHHDVPAGHSGGIASVPLEAEQLGEGDIGTNLDNEFTTSSNNSSRDSSSAGSNDADTSVHLARDLNLETYRFRPADLTAVGASGDRLPPFAIVASKDVLTPEQAAAIEREPGEPCRFYAWGPAFPYNRDHSDLIILKQLLCGHRNAAIHDLLQNSWLHAHRFVLQLQQLAIDQGDRLLGGYSNMAGLNDPMLLEKMVDDICSSACGASQLRDKLRTEEQKTTLTKLTAARVEVERLEDELASSVEQLRAANRQVKDLQEAAQVQVRQQASSASLEKRRRTKLTITGIAFLGILIAAALWSAFCSPLPYQLRTEEYTTLANLTAARANIDRLEGELAQLRVAHIGQVQDLQHQIQGKAGQQAPSFNESSHNNAEDKQTRTMIAKMTDTLLGMFIAAMMFVVYVFVVLRQGA